MALIRQCDVCGCEIANRTNGYYHCTKVVDLFYSVPRSSTEEENEGMYIIREKDEIDDVIEPIDICVSCFKEMEEFKKGKEI